MLRVIEEQQQLLFFLTDAEVKYNMIFEEEDEWEEGEDEEWEEEEW